MLVQNLDYDDYVGRLAIGRVTSGVIKPGQQVSLMKDNGVIKKEKIQKLFGFEGMKRVEMPEAGAGDIIGYVDALRIEGKKLLGDLHLLQNSPHRAYVLEIAEKIPDTFGLSIAFSGPVEMASDKKTMLQRCSEIYSVDLVSEPAANAEGLFERRMKSFQTESGTTPEEAKTEIEIKIPMNDDVKKEIAGMIESAMMGMTERLGKLEALACGTEPKPAAMSAKTDEVQLAAKQAAEAALKEFAKTIGAPAAPAASAEVATPAAKSEPKTFEAIVAAKTSELKGNKGDAIAFAIKNHATEYQQYRSRVAAGEVVKL